MASSNRNAFLNEAVPGLPFSLSSTTTSTPFSDGKLGFQVYLEISEAYENEYGYSLVYCDNQGLLIYGLPECQAFPCNACCAELRRTVLEEALNCGRPVVHTCGDSHGLWGVPVMLNNNLCGGLVVVGAELAKPPNATESDESSLADACQGLLSLAAKYNIVNLAFLESRNNKPLRMDRFSKPFYLETDQAVSQMQKYLSDQEPILLESIRNRDQEAAREKLEEIIGFISELPQDYLCLAKGFVLDLLIAMDHASMEAGSDFTTIMRLNCSLSLEIYQIEDPQALSKILIQGLDQSFNIISPYHKKKNDVLLKNILSYLEKNFHTNLSRESLAERFGISVSNLSHLLRRKMDRTFVEILNQYRVDRAAQLLVMTELPLIEIALECGFQDQSYFGKVFRSHYGMSPAKYRKIKLNTHSPHRSIENPLRDR